jgi:aromatic ring-opening dioxygenase catalytic subunit (LigB family)
MALPASGKKPSGGATSARLPVIYLPHGGGPWPFVDMGLPKRDVDSLAGYLRELRHLPASQPKALLVISAHWEEAVPTVMTSPRPPILYDYYGFPPESYQITWPAPGHPALAARVRELLSGAGIATAEDAQRGFDHGTFIPLKLTWPDAEIPTVQLSLERGLDPARHLAIGRALAPLRDEGVLIVGSGMSFHNLRAFRDPRSPAVAERFDAWLAETAAAAPSVRDDRLAKWTEAPDARFVHPREEHLIPLMVVAGAAGADRGATTWAGSFMGVKISGYHFG